jgi:hypothetical protein
MSNIALKIWDDEGVKTTFYTVWKHAAALSETDSFFEKYDAISQYKPYLQELTSLLFDVVADEYGAADDFFNRFENRVNALPPQGKVYIDEITIHYPDFPLRLYALRINNRNDLVVQFNGGLKSGTTAQQSDDLSVPFYEANHYAKLIEEALQDEMIIIDEANRRLLSFDGTEDIIL